MDHMAHEHSFFVPDLEYLSDLEGLVKYLGEKVSVGNVCLFCSGKGKSFWSMEAVQAHMVELSC
jgi:pre-60S factor REI1